jgi:hypothetical protein
MLGLPIWPSGSMLDGRAVPATCGRTLGRCPAVTAKTPSHAGWVPFHKLSQWLSYSLVEPLQWAGVTVTGLDALTGLPEYRNGGLLIDSRRHRAAHAPSLERRWKPADELVVEWRALTVTLLDELAAQVRAQLGLSAAQMPLACILEGGTWAAGREIAAEPARRRPAGADRQRRHRFLTLEDLAMTAPVHVVSHPLVQHKLTLMREKTAAPTASAACCTRSAC